MTLRHIRFTFRKLLVFASVGLMGAGFALVTPDADAGRRGGRGGSVRHSSRGGNRSAAHSRSH